MSVVLVTLPVRFTCRSLNTENSPETCGIPYVVGLAGGSGPVRFPSFGGVGLSGREGWAEVEGKCSVIALMPRATSRFAGLVFGTFVAVLVNCLHCAFDRLPCLFFRCCVYCEYVQ